MHESTSKIAAPTSGVDSIIFYVPKNHRVKCLTALSNRPDSAVEFKLVSRRWTHLSPEENIGILDAVQVGMQQVIWTGNLNVGNFWIGVEFGHVVIGDTLRADIIYDSQSNEPDNYGKLSSNEVYAAAQKAGRPLVLDTTALAGNVEYDIAPTRGKRWIIVSGKIQISTDLNASDRYIRVFKLTGSDVYEEMFQNTAAIVASQTGMLSFGEMKYSNGVNITNTPSGNLSVYAGIDEIELDYGETLRIGILGGLVGDSWRARIKYREIDLG